MKDCTEGAEELFRDFARRHSFAIKKIDDPNVELLMHVPAQPGLSFELSLGLQNNDELGIGFDGFWSTFFPYASKRQFVSEVLDAIAKGDCRLAVHTQLGAVVKRVLERRSSGEWETLYTAFVGIQVPLLGMQVSYLYNEGALQW